MIRSRTRARHTQPPRIHGMYGKSGEPNPYGAFVDDSSGVRCSRRRFPGGFPPGCCTARSHGWIAKKGRGLSDEEPEAVAGGRSPSRSRMIPDWEPAMGMTSGREIRSRSRWGADSRAQTVPAAGLAAPPAATVRCSRAAGSRFALPADALVRSPGCFYTGEIGDFATARLGRAYCLSHTAAGGAARPVATTGWPGSGRAASSPRPPRPRPWWRQSGRSARSGSAG